MTMSREPAGDDPRPAHEDPQPPRHEDTVDRVDPATTGDRAAGALPFEDRPSTDDPETHTAALQGAAAGGAASGNAGYATGLLTGSEDDIGIRPIPEPADTSGRSIDDWAPVADGLPPGPPPEVAADAVAEIRANAASDADADVDADAGSIMPGAIADRGD